MDIRKVKKLMELLEQSGMSEIEIKEGEESVKISRFGNSPMPTQTNFHQPAPTIAPSIPAAPTSIAKPQSNNQAVTSPMVGTYYSAPSPTAKPFITVGQKIQQGDTIGIIEAMKIMNPLEATQSGIIDEILVDNSEVVQFGQPVIRYKA